MEGTKTADELKQEGESGMTFTFLSDLLAEDDENVSWLVDNMLPTGGFSVLAGKPKAGKSTLARNLALNVAQGGDFLDRKVQAGPVLYLALEEKRAEVKKHFRDMGATGEEDICIFASSAPVDALQQVRAVAEQVKPALIIIDPLFRFARVRDSNDYAQVTQVLEPILRLARDTGCHVLCVHHMVKGERQGGDSILGSTAIFGSVDTAILLKRGDKYRTLQTQQRYGEDLVETTLHCDAETRTTTLGQSRQEEGLSAMEEALLEFLRDQEAPRTEAEISDAVQGRKVLKVTALRSLVREGTVTGEGKGGKGDPFRYSRSHVSTYMSGTTKQKTENTRNPNDSVDYSCSHDQAENLTRETEGVLNNADPTAA